MSVRTNLLSDTNEDDLADELIKLLFGLDTAKEARSQAKRIYDSAWRDKMRVARCRPGRRCGAPTCPICLRRQKLIEMIEDTREVEADKRAGALRQQRKYLTDLDDSELADELLNVTLGIPTRAEVLRRAKKVYRLARRRGLESARNATA